MSDRDPGQKSSELKRSLTPRIDHKNAVVHFETDFPLGPGEHGSPGYCCHSLRFDQLQRFINLLVDIEHEIGPLRRKLPYEKKYEPKIGRF